MFMLKDFCALVSVSLFSLGLVACCVGLAG